MKTNWIEDVKNNPLFAYQEYMPSSLDIAADTKMRPGFAAVLYQATCEDIAKFHQILSVNAGIDSVEDMECVPTYAIYQDTRGHIHQLYSYLEKSVDQQDGEGLPDHVATWLDQAEHTPLKSFTDDSSSLEILVQAQCKTIQFSHTLSRSDYYDSSKCPSNPTATYTMSYKVYAVHNLDDETDYYLVEQEGMYPFKNVCASTYKKSVGGALSKIQEYYGGHIVETCRPKNIMNAQHCHIERTSPSTTTSTTVSVGLDINLAGSYSYSSADGHTASVSGGLNIKNDRSYQISDITISNQSEGSTPKAEWNYDFKRTISHFNFFSYGQVEIDDCALSARSTFVSESEWLFHVSKDGISGDELQLEASISVDLVSSRARLDYPCHTGCVHKTNNAQKSVVLSVKRPPVISQQK